VTLPAFAFIAAVAASFRLDDGPVPSLPGENTLVYNSGTQAIGVATATLTFDSAAYDGLAAYDAGAPTRLTIPAGFDGRRCRVIAGVYGARGGYMEAKLNGAAFIGRSGGSTLDQASPNLGCFLVSAPVVVYENDYFEVDFTGSHASMVTAANRSWMALEIIPTEPGACVRKTGTQAITGSTDTALSMDSEFYDNGGWFDPGSPTRLTVPAGGSGLVRLSAGLRFSSGLSENALFIRKNGSSDYGLPYQEMAGFQRMGAMSAVITVSAGDYFELFVRTNTGHTYPATDETWFCIEEVPSATQHALVRKTGSQTPGASADAPLTWVTEVSDVGGWFDSGSPTRFTVPSGVTKVRLSGNIERGSEGNMMLGYFRKNGAAIPGVAFQSVATTGGEILSVCSTVLEVTAGDYFELTVITPQSSSINATLNTWFGIEAL
jgi:hypothetical protein